jgi:hypothetical protein
MAPKHRQLRQLRILPGFVAVVIAEEIEEMMSFPPIFCRYFSFLGRSTAVLWEYTGNMFHFWGSWIGNPMETAIWMKYNDGGDHPRMAACFRLLK